MYASLVVFARIQANRYTRVDERDRRKWRECVNWNHEPIQPLARVSLAFSPDFSRNLARSSGRAGTFPRLYKRLFFFFNLH